ncbi:Uncharacterised protein [uncultured archaeon]|nr:Uncharacterised protein [uncultured archaeon]
MAYSNTPPASSNSGQSGSSGIYRGPDITGPVGLPTAPASAPSAPASSSSGSHTISQTPPSAPAPSAPSEAAPAPQPGPTASIPGPAPIQPSAPPQAGTPAPVQPVAPLTPPSAQAKPSDVAASLTPASNSQGTLDNLGRLIAQYGPAALMASLLVSVVVGAILLLALRGHGLRLGRKGL